jgi:flagellin
MVVQHNMQAMNTNRQLGITTSAQAKSTEKLSSGYKINRAGDDAAGLAISEKMRSQIRGLDKASTNAQDGISVVQTAEGALNEVHSILQRMNELATQAANDTNTSTDRNSLSLEISQLGSEIDRIASTTQFNTMNLLDGSFTGKKLQVGALSGQSIELNISSMKCSGLFGAGVTAKNVMSSKLAVSSFASAGRTMSNVQAAIDTVSTQRATLGAVQNRLEHTIANLDTTSENTSAAESRIRDTDMASEMVTYSKNNILAQAGQSMLAQANQSTQGVLSLLG